MSAGNAGRLEAARFALRSHQWAKGDAFDEDPTAIIDLLTDMRHYCEAHDLCFDDADRIAASHYSAECQEGGSS